MESHRLVRAKSGDRYPYRPQEVWVRGHGDQRVSKTPGRGSIPRWPASRLNY